MMFTAWLTWALYFLLRGLSALPPRPAHLVGFYVCVAGALWTKGLPALMVIPATVAACLASGAIRRLPSLRPWTGLGLVALTALPWAIPYALTPEHASSQTIGASHAVTWYFDRYRTPSSIPLAGGLGGVPAVGIVADPGRRVVAPLVGSPGLSTGAGLDARLRRPGGAERPATRALPAPRLSDPGAVRGRGGDRGRISRTGHVRLNTIILIVMLAGALAAAGWLLLANLRGSRGRRSPSSSRPRRGRARSSRGSASRGPPSPSGSFGRAARRAAPCCVAGALALVLLFEASHIFRPPGDDVPDPLVRRPRPSLARPQRAAAGVPRCEPGLRLLPRSSDRGGARSSDDRRVVFRARPPAPCSSETPTGRTCVEPLIPAGAPSIG